MATVGWKVLKLGAIVGTLPAVAVGLGYRMRSVQASENNGIGGRHIFRATELPLYRNPDSDKLVRIDSDVMDPPYPRNAMEEQIGVVRKAVQEFLLSFEDTYETVIDKSKIGIDHTKATLDYVQNNPGELPRVIFIAVAGMGGVVLGYRGGPLRKLTYGTIAALSSAALCYPKKTVELSKVASDEFKTYWKQYVGDDATEKIWPFSKTESKKELVPQSKTPDKVTGPKTPKETKQTEELIPPIKTTNQPVKIIHNKPAFVPYKEPERGTHPKKSEKGDKKDGVKTPGHVIVEVKEVKPKAESKPLPKTVAGDPGQSTPEDKDMYTTRSS